MQLLTGLDEALEFISRRQAVAADDATAEAVRAILAAVRDRGDEAVREYGARFDRVDVRHLRVPAGALATAHAAFDPELLASLRLAAARVRAYYSHQLEHGFEFEDGDSRLGMITRPLDSVGCYVPGGQAPLFSSLVMLAVPAQVAGVPRIAVASPPGPDGLPHQAILAAAFELGLAEVYAMGGAQAVAALAWGTESVARVDKIVGPGNRFVVHAKRQVFGAVGIESLPGPTETLVLADAGADPAHVVADLLAQAEHADAVPILVSDDRDLIDSVVRDAAAAAADLPTAREALESLHERGAAIVVGSLAEGMEAANAFAPEHLCLLVADPEALLPLVRNAGGVFLGSYSMEALGDYAAGPSHVMPTGGSARFSSFVNVRDFQRVMPVIRAGPGLVARTGPDAARLARAEGLEAHARAIESRLG